MGSIKKKQRCYEIGENFDLFSDRLDLKRKVACFRLRQIQFGLQFSSDFYKTHDPLDRSTGTLVNDVHL